MLLVALDPVRCGFRATCFTRRFQFPSTSDWLLMKWSSPRIPITLCLASWHYAHLWSCFSFALPPPKRPGNFGCRPPRKETARCTTLLPRRDGIHQNSSKQQLGNFHIRSDALDQKPPNTSLTTSSHVCRLLRFWKP